MVATKSPTTASRPLLSTPKLFDIVQTAIREENITKARDLLKERNKRQFMFREWASLIDTGVSPLEDKLRADFRSVLIELARDKILNFLRSALQSSEEEQVAMLILHHRPDLFLTRLDGDLVFHLAASNNEVEVIKMFLRFAEENNHHDLVTRILERQEIPVLTQIRLQPSP